uniref:Uncharacterized protein n=1 Tax=Timema tahoe TaxID=61484 RepID=A0A7R9IKE2_9NEOP|nr:unnamed protein product [Timema tahoe]
MGEVGDILGGKHMLCKKKNHFTLVPVVGRFLEIPSQLIKWGNSHWRSVSRNDLGVCGKDIFRSLSEQSDSRKIDESESKARRNDSTALLPERCTTCVAVQIPQRIHVSSDLPWTSWAKKPEHILKEEAEDRVHWWSKFTDERNGPVNLAVVIVADRAHEHGHVGLPQDPLTKKKTDTTTKTPKIRDISTRNIIREAGNKHYFTSTRNLKLVMAKLNLNEIWNQKIKNVVRHRRNKLEHARVQQCQCHEITRILEGFHDVVEEKWELWKTSLNDYTMALSLELNHNVIKRFGTNLRDPQRILHGPACSIFNIILLDHFIINRVDKSLDLIAKP